MIKEAKETKEAIDDATAAMQNANVVSHHTEQKKSEAMQMSSTFESNLFDFHGGAGSGGAPQYQNSGPPPGDMYGSQPPAPQPIPAPGGIPMVQTVSSEEPEGAEAGDKEEGGDDDDSDGQELFSNEYGRPAPAPVPGPAPSPMPQPQQYSAPPTPQYVQPSVYSQPPSAQPTPNTGRPAAVSRHTPRQSSAGFNSEFIMGGSAEPLPDGGETGISPAARTKSSSADFGYEDEESYQNVEEMKRKAESAAEAARDAEAAHRRLMNEADELRADADKAEATARSLKAAAAEKKKGRFGRSGGDKKKIMVRAGTPGDVNVFYHIIRNSPQTCSEKWNEPPRMPKTFANDSWRCQAKPETPVRWRWRRDARQTSCGRPLKRLSWKWQRLLQ